MGTLTQTVAGTYSFTAPTGVTSVNVQCWGGGGGGGGGSYGGGGGGGEYAAEFGLSVTPGNSYTYVVGAGGAGGASGANGVAGGNSTFNSTSVVAHGGSKGNTGSPGTGGAGGTGSTNSDHNNGGAGAAGTASSVGGGGGGGGSGISGGGAGSGQIGGGADEGSGAGGAGGSATGCVDAVTRIWILDPTNPEGGVLTKYFDVSPGDKTLALDENGNQIEAEITAVAIHPGDWTAMKINGDITAVVTLDHRWYVKDETDAWVYKITNDLTDTDRVMLRDGTLVAWGDQRRTIVHLFRQTVWCPTTTAGNWLAWKPDSSYFIGNKP